MTATITARRDASRLPLGGGIQEWPRGARLPVTLRSANMRKRETCATGFLFFKTMAFHRKLYDVHRQMLRRCEEPQSADWPNYGGRGIKVCAEWQDVNAFTHWALTHGYAKGLTLDRTDTNGNYCPANCRWATVLEQARNARRVVMLTVDGQTKPLVEWAEQVGISQRTMKMRLKLGWSHKDTVTIEPVRGRNQYT